VGTLGFEPRSAGFHQAGCDPARFTERRVLAPVIHHGVSEPLQVMPITGAHQSTGLAYVPLRRANSPGAYVVFSRSLGSGRPSLLPHLLLALAAAHPLLAPLPAHLPTLLPRPRAPLQSGPRRRRKRNPYLNLNEQSLMAGPRLSGCAWDFSRAPPANSGGPSSTSPGP